MKFKTYLVTGGCGFIGSHIVDELLDNSSACVINIDKMGVGSSLDNVRNDAINYFFDINSDQTADVFKLYRPDYVIHCAAESHVDRSIEDPMSFIDSNVRGTSMVLEAMKKYTPNARVAHVSTDEVYGHLKLEDPPFTENSNLNPRSPYSASKASSDMIAFSYRETYGSNITVTRCCNNYGPRQHSEKLIPTILNSLMGGTRIPVYGNGQNIREWIYVKDHVNAILEILHNHSGKLYNIYGTKTISNLDIIRIIISTYLGHSDFNIDDYITFVEDRKGHDFKYAMSSIYKEVKSLENQITFEEGMRQTVDYYITK